MTSPDERDIVERLRPALKLLDGLKTGQRCEEYAFAEANGFQAMTYLPEAFEALRALPGVIDLLEKHRAAVEANEGNVERITQMLFEMDGENRRDIARSILIAIGEAVKG